MGLPLAAVGAVDGVGAAVARQDLLRLGHHQPPLGVEADPLPRQRLGDRAVPSARVRAVVARDEDGVGPRLRGELRHRRRRQPPADAQLAPPLAQVVAQQADALVHEPDPVRRRPTPPEQRVVEDEERHDPLRAFERGGQHRQIVQAQIAPEPDDRRPVPPRPCLGTVTHESRLFPTSIPHRPHGRATCRERGFLAHGKRYHPARRRAMREARPGTARRPLRFWRPAIVGDTPLPPSLAPPSHSLLHAPPSFRRGVSYPARIRGLSPILARVFSPMTQHSPVATLRRDQPGPMAGGDGSGACGRVKSRGRGLMTQAAALGVRAAQADVWAAAATVRIGEGR